MATVTPAARNQTGLSAGSSANGDLAPRLRLRPFRPEGAAPPVGTRVDGGWWPRSTDLCAELPPLLSALRSAGYEIERISYNLAFWEPAPRRLTVSSPTEPIRLVKLGGFRYQDPALISLIDRRRRSRLDLLVIPPDTPVAAAQRALQLAGTTGDRLTPGQILERAATPLPAGRTGSAQDEERAIQRWDTDGGRRSGVAD